MIAAHEEERRILGALLLTPATYDAVFYDHGLRAEDFEVTRYGAVYRAMGARVEAVGTFDRLTIRQALGNTGTLQEAGGDATLDELDAPVPQIGLLPEYVRGVRDRSSRRRMALMARQLLDGLDDPSKSVTELARHAEATALTVGYDDRRQSIKHIRDVLDKEQERLADLEQDGGKDVTGIPTGFHELDMLTGGGQPGQLIVIGARPAMGKSAFVTNISENAALHGFATVVFSLEMPEGEIARRLMSSRTHIRIDHVSRGQIGADRWPGVMASNAQLAAAPLWIDDTPDISIPEIRAKLRRHAKTNPLDMVVVDYLQLARAEGRSNDNRAQIVGEMSRGLKVLARELNVTVVFLSQLNRSLESRPDKTPQLSDLRESGQIEQDADQVWFLYREEVYDEESDRKGEADVIVAKHRGGALAEVPLRFTGRFMRFDNPTDLRAL